MLNKNQRVCVVGAGPPSTWKMIDQAASTRIGSIRGRLTNLGACTCSIEMEREAAASGFSSPERSCIVGIRWSPPFGRR